MKWNKIILKNFRMIQCFTLTWNHIWNEIKLFKEFYFNMALRLKWNKIILAAHVGICMRQSCCSQSQHLSSVIAWRHLQAAGSRRETVNSTPSRHQQAPAQLNASLNSAHSLKLFYIISWWNHAWNKIILGRSTDGAVTAAARVWKIFISAWNHVWNEIK